MSETDTQSDDQRLVAAVRAAASAGEAIDPATVEARVGREALVNTHTGLPLEALRGVDLGPDPDHPDEVLDLDSARAVIYWGRPVESHDPRVVGVQIDANGRAAVFFAVVYPP